MTQMLVSNNTHHKGTNKDTSSLFKQSTECRRESPKPLYNNNKTYFVAKQMTHVHSKTPLLKSNKTQDT